MEKLYNQLIVAYSAAYPDKTGKMVQLNVANIWKEMKAKNDKEQLHSVVKQQIQEWTRKSMQKRQPSSICGQRYVILYLNST